ncbi:hypothetical protein FQZ97_1052750 [compost metagenome]
MLSLLHHQHARAAAERDCFSRLVADMRQVIVGAVRGGKGADADHHRTNRRKAIGVHDVVAARHWAKCTDQQRLVFMPAAGELS